MNEEKGNLAGPSSAIPEEGPSSDVEIEVLAETDVAELERLQPGLFTSSEPTMQAAGVTKEQELGILQMYTPHFLASGCSFVARDRASRELLGFCLAYDNDFPDPDAIAEMVGEWIDRYRPSTSFLFLSQFYSHILLVAFPFWGWLEQDIGTFIIWWMSTCKRGIGCWTADWWRSTGR